MDPVLAGIGDVIGQARQPPTFAAKTASTPMNTAEPTFMRLTATGPA